jgi:hypothetical protein
MLARQLDAPAATYANGTVTWVPANNGAIAYALFKNDVFVGLTEGFTFQVEAGEDDVLTIRSANSCGGLGAPAVVTSVSTSISEVATESADSDAPAYNTAGQRVDRTFHGIVIKNGRKVVNK